MGHLYPKNISKYLIHKLFNNWLNREKIGVSSYVSKGYLNNPKSLKVEDVVKHFVKRINQMKRIISLAECGKDVTLLTGLMKQNFGVNCSEGSYLEEEMIEMAIYECLSTWKQHGIVEEISDEWFLKEKIIKSGTKLDDSLIKAIVQLLEKNEVDKNLIKYTFKSLEEIGNIYSYTIDYIDI